MKKIIVLFAVMFVLGATCYAQNENYNYTYNRQGEQYVANYYGHLNWGANGFRTAEEENALQERMLADLRLQRHLDSMSSSELAAWRQRQMTRRDNKYFATQARQEKQDAKKNKTPDAKPAVKKDTATAKKAPETAKKPQEVKKEPVTTKKEEPKKKK